MHVMERESQPCQLVISPSSDSCFNCFEFQWRSVDIQNEMKVTSDTVVLVTVTLKKISAKLMELKRHVQTIILLLHCLLQLPFLYPWSP